MFQWISATLSFFFIHDFLLQNATGNLNAKSSRSSQRQCRLYSPFLVWSMFLCLLCACLARTRIHRCVCKILSCSSSSFFGLQWSECLYLFTNAIFYMQTCLRDQCWLIVHCHRYANHQQLCHTASRHQYAVWFEQLQMPTPKPMFICFNMQ